MKKLLIKCFFIISIAFINFNNAIAEIAFSFDNVNLVSAINILSPEINRNIAIE